MHASSVRLPRALALLAAGALVAVACTSGTATRGTGQTTSGAAPAIPATDAAVLPVAPSAAPESAAEVSVPAWLDIELTDVTTGSSFRLSDLRGTVVAIEPMAIWCSTCRTQQDLVREAYPHLEASGVRYISLDVEPNERAEALADYAAQAGYGWTFALSPRELSRALADEFGPQVLAPPSTPLIVLSPDGTVAYQDFGLHGPERLVEVIAEAAA